MKRILMFAALVAALVGCNLQNPAEPDPNGAKANLTTAQLVSASPVVGSQVKKGDEVSVVVAFSYDVTALTQDNVQPRLFSHRAGDPSTMLTLGMMFPHGNSYMELPPKGNLTLTFDGDLGGRAFYDAEPGSTIDYVVLAFMHKTGGKLDFVSYNIDGHTSMDSQPLYLNWNIK